MTDLPRYLELVWGRAESRPGPAPRLTIGEIAWAAVELADRGGLGAVTMKSVGESLGVGSMALYRYVDTKEHLHVVLLDHAYGPPVFDYPASAGWRERTDAWARAVVARLLDHLWMVEVPLYAPPLTPNILAWTEKGHAALSEAPLDAAQRYSVLTVLDGWCKEQVRTGTQLGYLGSARPDTTVEYARQLFDLLDPEQHPLLSAANLELARTPSPPGGFFSSQFEFGLEVVLDGIERLINRGRRT